MHHIGPVAGVATHEQWVATAGYDNRLILWEAQTRTAIARANHDHLVNNCSFSHDGKWLVSASSDYSARIWSVPDMRLHAVLPDHCDDVDMALFSPDDRLIATCALDRCVRVFDRSGRCLQVMTGHSGNVLSLAWINNRYLLSTSVDGTIRRWDVESGMEIARSELGIRTDCAEVSPHGHIYAGDDRGRIAIINGNDCHFVNAHRAGIKQLTLDATQGMIDTLSYDRAIATWRIEPDGSLTAVARSVLPEAIWARAAAVCADGRIAVGTFGSTYALFDPATTQWDMTGVAAGEAINAILALPDANYTIGDAGAVLADGKPVAEMGSLCNFLVASGTDIYTGGQMGRLFNARIGATLYEHHSPLNCGVSFVRNGSPHIAIGTYTGEILIFLAEDQGMLRYVTQLRPYENAVKGLAFAQGQLFSVCASTDIAWHDVLDWSPVRTKNNAHERIANACCALGEGRFASVGRDRRLRIWDGADAETYESPHPNSVKCIAVDTDRSKILTGSYGGTVAQFDLHRREWVHMQRISAAGISSIAWNPTRSCFVAASYDGQIHRVAA